MHDSARYRPSADWQTASQGSASSVYSQGDATDTEAAWEATLQADEYADDAAAAVPSVDLASDSYAASDVGSTTLSEALWQMGITGSRAGSTGTASAAGSRPGSVRSSTAAPPDSPISGSAVRTPPDGDGVSCAAENISTPARRTATHTSVKAAASPTAHGTTSRASSSRGSLALGATLGSAGGQLDVDQPDAAADTASLSSWAAADSDRPGLTNDGLIVGGAGNGEGLADAAGVDNPGDGLSAAQQWQQVEAEAADGAGGSTVYPDAARPSSADLSIGVAAGDAAADEQPSEVSRLMPGNWSPSVSQAADAAADEGAGEPIDQHDAKLLLIDSTDSYEDGTDGSRLHSPARASWHEPQLPLAAEWGADASDAELSEGEEAIFPGAAAQEQQLPELPERDHITLAAAAAAAE